MGIAPESELFRSRLLFGRGIPEPIVGRLFFLIFLVVPGHTRFDLSERCVRSFRAMFAKTAALGRRHPYLTDEAPVPIKFSPLDPHAFLEDERGQRLLRPFAEGLLFLRRVDAGQANLVDLLFRVENGDRVAVTDADDLPGERVGGCRRRNEKENQRKDKTSRPRRPSLVPRSTAWCGVPRVPRRYQMKHRESRSGGDVYQRATAEIVKAIERGIGGEYQMPWHRGASLGFPTNALSHRPYHGFNTLALWAASEMRGYAVPIWATYRQWEKLQAQVRKGEKATPILFYKEDVPRESSDELPDTQKHRIVVRASFVFNAAQVDGWRNDDPVAVDRTIRLAEVERFVDTVGAEVSYGGDCACYQPAIDRIYMPKRAFFTGTKTSSATESFYAVLLHEHIHWTGHRSRIDRDLSSRFGSNGYAMEELVAELGAAFLCAELGITLEPRIDHARYVQSWLTVLREKHMALASAASAATRACRYLTELGAPKQQT